MAGDSIAAAKAIQSDSALKESVRSASSPEAKRQVIEEAGHTGLTPEQGEAWQKVKAGQELSDDDLARIAGGKHTSTTVSKVVSAVSEDACEDVADAAA